MIAYPQQTAKVEAYKICKNKCTNSTEQKLIRNQVLRK